mmetsp:Transcript_53713/g.96557  ORF Transcript_53713/g.96557 Transcript_53713/m.96557 type:complete len:110 (+) Transcript_53713:1184-1513(+)
MIGGELLPMRAPPKAESTNRLTLRLSSLARAAPSSRESLLLTSALTFDAPLFKASSHSDDCPETVSTKLLAAVDSLLRKPPEWPRRGAEEERGFAMEERGLAMVARGDR